MAQLALRGHATRGKEVIEILEMLGGKSYTGLAYKGEAPDRCYCINKVSNFIDSPLVLHDVQVFSLEEFLEKFPYKVGDKVVVSETQKTVTIEYLSWRDDKIVYETCYNDDCVAFYSSEELQPYKEETMESKPNLFQQLKEYFDNTPRDVLEKEWNELSYLNEIGPTVAEYLECVKKYRQSNQYPNIYEECCDILKIEYPYFKTEEDGISASTYKNKLFGALKQLLICRDAYWKIYGEQMGLGKPWEPDFTNDNEERYGIYTTANKVVKDFCGVGDVNVILTFPTEEMRDAFYENFKELIESCKELL